MENSRVESIESNLRVERGLQFVEKLWWQLAKRIMLMAGELYGWDNEQWKEMQELFLRPNDYKVVVNLGE
jgi:hypothetical protein